MSIDRFWILIARKLSGESSLEEIRELEDLLRIHPHLYFSVEIITNLWNQRATADKKLLDDSYASHVEKMKGMGISFAHDAHKEEADLPYLLHGSRNSRFFRKLSIAASVLIILIASLFFYSSQKSKSTIPPTDDLRGLAAVTTKFGSRTNIELPDGSKVWLNSGSRITYDKQFGKDIREVVLSGEAYFDVVRNPEKPFIIHTSSMDIKVLGTQFNVKSYANDKISEASLIRGSIEVSLKRRGSEKILLKPNEKIVVMNDRLVKENTFAPVKNNPVEQIMAIQKLNYDEKDSTIIETSWVDNKLSFQNESFEDIAIRMERWYGIPVLFEEDSLKTEHFTGTFTNETIQQALEALQITISFKYHIKDNRIIITK